jgi:carbonic anhydrase/acetyltransferase-like protein (isoleucine patch superfamily)
MGAIVLDDSVVGERALVGANSLVTEGTEIPPNALATGTPAEVRKEVDDSPWARAGDVYVELSERHGTASETLYERWPPDEED